MTKAWMVDASSHQMAMGVAAVATPTISPQPTVLALNDESWRSPWSSHGCVDGDVGEFLPRPAAFQRGRVVIVGAVSFIVMS